MLTLLGNVAGDAGEVADADGEGSVSTLPLEILAVMGVLGDQMGRGPFHMFHQIGDRQRRGQAYQQMHVILHAAEPGALTPSITRSSPGVSPCLCSEPATAGLVAERCDALQARFQPPRPL